MLQKRCASKSPWVFVKQWDDGTATWHSPTENAIAKVTREGEIRIGRA